MNDKSLSEVLRGIHFTNLLTVESSAMLLPTYSNNILSRLISMGLFNWTRKFRLDGMIAQNAYTQYHKWKKMDPSSSESDIAGNIFLARYVIANSIISKEGRGKLTIYIERDFELKTLMDFCLVSLDVEGEINPSDMAWFFEVADLIKTELARLGFKSEDEDIVSFCRRWNSIFRLTS